VLRWLLLSWATNAIVLGLAGWLLSGMTFHGSAWTVIIAAAVFGILNTILKPVLKLLTLPFAVITLGIAWFFVSMFMLWLTAIIVPDFSIHGFWNYVWATVIIWILNMIVDAVLSPDRRGGAAAIV
jgi:putative membrane protein